MREAVRKKLMKAAKKGRRIAIAAVAGAVVLSSNISYAQEIGIEDVFDEHYYADEYSDLKEVYGYARALLLEHFMKFGLLEGRQMNEMIDIVEYREKYPDLQDAFGDDWDAYVSHYFSYGAFEHRDNGTGFDPVDYLNRYSDLQAVLGTDIMAAYKHYKEFGKQEGREGRSEATVMAEKEAAIRAKEVAAKDKETAVKVEEDTSSPAEPEKGGFAIQSVEVMGNGRIRVTLNQKTEQPLALGAFSIICNSGGSDMTILSVSTNDNMVYDLATTYYRDQEYDIQITLADGTAISKVFVYRTDCAQIAGISAARTSAGEARITYNSDQPGYFCYILKESGQDSARAVSMESTEITESEIIGNGVKVEMKQHENSFIVSGLSEGMSYTMHYVAVNTEGKSTLVKSLSIGGEVYEDNTTAIQRAEAFAEKLENGEFLYGFEIELESATSESLVLEQFDISCPSSQTTLGEVRTSDNRIYRVYMQRGSIPNGNNTYTILINMKDGTQLKGTCYLDLQAPRVDVRSIEWTDVDTIKVVVNSDEAGTLYYAIQDEVEGEGTIVAKDPTQIYAQGMKVSIGYGLNYITVTGITAGQWFCCASEDERGNREDFYSYEQIPEYTAPNPEPDDSVQPEITGVTVLKASDRATLKVVFNQTINGLYDNSQTQISGIDKRLSFEATYSSEGDLVDNVLTLSVLDSSISIPEGSHTLSIGLEDGTILTFDFTV
ncbi:hypothetical protein D3Z45_07695 [Lachnospiraceae bacterium]|nr:hypothetical protein [Lachnospiraceae bacterium]